MMNFHYLCNIFTFNPRKAVRVPVEDYFIFSCSLCSSGVEIKQHITIMAYFISLAIESIIKYGMVFVFMIVKI